MVRTSRLSIRRFLLCGLVICAPAYADITYVGSFDTATNTVTYSITTDGALGLLSQSDIVSVAFSDSGTNAFSTTVASGGPDTIYAQDLTATATTISFDFQDNNYAQSCFGGPASPNSCYAVNTPMIYFDDVGTGAGNPYWSNGVEGFQGPAGEQYIATPLSAGDVIATATPEPGTMVATLVGSMILGLATWKRRRQARRSGARAAAGISHS